MPIDPDHLYSLLRTILQQVKNHTCAWPFQKPVERSEAPDYYEHIKYPMGKCSKIPFVLVVDVISSIYTMLKFLVKCCILGHKPL